MAAEGGATETETATETATADAGAAPPPTTGPRGEYELLKE